MKKPLKRVIPQRMNKVVTPISDGLDPRLLSAPQPDLEGAELEAGVRKAISTHLHDLLNALWPAATRIELLISEDSCPAKFRETLEQLARCVAEAMAIASEASSLVDLPPGDSTPM